MGVYSKPHLSYEAQLNILTARGLSVSDRENAIWWLSNFGYYSFGSYLYTMRKIENKKVQDDFLEGATFECAIALIQFDQTLRRLCLDALEVIERSIKVRTAFALGKFDKFAHSVFEFFESRDIQRSRKKFESWQNSHKSKIKRRHHETLPKFVKKYGHPLPIWVATEAMDFGDLDNLISQLKNQYQLEIARECNFQIASEFASWVSTLRCVRNIAAHHERLWNRTLVAIPSTPTKPKDQWFDGLPRDQKYWSRTYVALLIIAKFMNNFDPKNDWAFKVGQHLLTLPVGVGISYERMGAPPNWQKSPVWKLS